MFRRGASLPARPLIPNKDEILEDMANTSSDDVIYELNGQKYDDDNTFFPKICEDLELEDVETSSISYLKVESFLDKINCLKNYLVNMDKQKANLQKLEENLIQDMDKIKKELKSNTQSS